MTAKHRKGKGNHKHEDNFFKQDALESEVRGGGNNYALLFILFLMIVIGGATGAWFSFQQNQTITYLADSLMGMQMKVVKLQSSQEEIRQANNKQHASEGLEPRLNALEESYALAQKQVGMALATAEQLKTSDLPAQVLSLHTEMKARLTEMQQATVSLVQLGQLQSMLKAQGEEFEEVRLQVEGLAGLSAELSQRVEVLTGSLGEAESKLEERVGHVATLSTILDGQASEVLGLKEQLAGYNGQLEANTLEMATVRELLEKEVSQRVQHASVEEQLSTVRQSLQDQSTAAHSLTSDLRAQLEIIHKQVAQLGGEEASPVEQVESAAQDEAAPATEEDSAAPADTEPEEAPAAEEEEEAVLQDEAPVEQVDSVTEETAPSEEPMEEQTQQDATANEAVDETQAEEEISEGDLAPEESLLEEEEASEGEQALEDLPVEEEEASEGEQALEDSPVEEASEGEEALEESLLEEEEASEGEQALEDSPVEEGEEALVESPLEDENREVEEEVSEGEEEQEDIRGEEESHKDEEAAEEEGPPEDDALPKDK